MEILHWIGELLQNAGIISGFIFTIHTIRKDDESRRLSNTLQFIQHHHAIWKQMYERPELFRITDKGAVLDTKPLTQEERLFLTELILHLDGVHRAMKMKMIVNIEGLQKDVKDFFALPLPKAAWEILKAYQDKDFVEFIEKV